MSRSIKQLKPNKNSKFKQGYFDVSESLKYEGKEACIFRSGLEKRFFEFFESNDKITKWESEPELSVKYMYGGKLRTYWLDAIIVFAGKTWLIEIKPFSQTVLPKAGRNPISHKNAMATFEQNVAKWTAAKVYAEQNDAVFAILTERFFDR